jgi:hypothetical protein
VIKVLSVEKNVVHLESDLQDYGLAITELQSKEARDMAIEAGVKAGIRGASVAGWAYQPYPVDVEGKEIPPGAKAAAIHSYHVEIPLAASIR